MRERNRMNIIYLHTHDSGRFFSPRGYQDMTPEIDAFSKTAMVFQQAYCAAPTCSPSRAALLTGQSPHACGMTGLAHIGTGWRLNEYRHHLASFLRENGYETVLCGIQHEAPITEMIGYSQIIGRRHLMNEKKNVMESLDYDNTQTACEYLRAHVNANSPFFLSVGLFSTHREFPAEIGSVDLQRICVPKQLPDCAQIRDDFAHFQASLRVADNCIGKIIQAVRDYGLENNTMILLTTDHGIAFPRMKCTLYDDGIGVNLIIRIPGITKQGSTDVLVSHLDVFPTICDVIGVAKPEWLEGYSMLPYLTGTADRVRDAIFAEVTYHVSYEPQRCVRTERYKLIRYFENAVKMAPANIDDSMSKELLVSNGFLEQHRDEVCMYDLLLDPCERVNLAYDPGHQDIRDSMEKMLERWMLDTNDPLLNGHVCEPGNSYSLPSTVLSPKELKL